MSSAAPACPRCGLPGERAARERERRRTWLLVAFWLAVGVGVLLLVNNGMAGEGLDWLDGATET